MTTKPYQKYTLKQRLTMNECYQVPNYCKEQPGEEERCREPEYGPTPAQFYQTCEEILHVPSNHTKSEDQNIPLALPGDIDLVRPDVGVDLAVLGDHPVPLGLGMQHLQYARLFPEGVPGVLTATRRQGPTEKVCHGLSDGISRVSGATVHLRLDIGLG